MPMESISASAAPDGKTMQKPLPKKQEEAGSPQEGQLPSSPKKT